MVQNKLKSIEDTICWINQEEALFKFPQSSYPDVGDVNTIQSGEGKMKSNIDPYARLFTTVLKWQKAEKKWTDGSFLELNAEQIEADINAFSKYSYYCFKWVMARHDIALPLRRATEPCHVMTIITKVAFLS